MSVQGVHVPIHLSLMGNTLLNLQKSNMRAFLMVSCALSYLDFKDTLVKTIFSGFIICGTSFHLKSILKMIKNYTFMLDFGKGFHHSDNRPSKNAHNERQTGVGLVPL